MIFIEKPPLWFWHLDGIDTGALRRVGDAWCAFGEVDLRGTFFAGGFAERPLMRDTMPNFDRFILPNVSADTVHVQDHLRGKEFVQPRRWAIPEPNGTYMRPTPITRHRYVPPDDTFHECDACALARSCGHPMDPVRLCKGCAHNKEVIERLNHCLDEMS